jgi:GDP-L-fucose synthase
MARSNILVCGSTGFIGRNIAERLCKRDDVTVYGHHHRRPPLGDPRIVPVAADLTDPDDARRVVAGMDVVIQAAATTSGAKDIVERPYIHVTDNAVMNSHLLQAAFDCKVGHFIFFSCSVMYPSSDLPLEESQFTGDSGIHPRYFGIGWTKVYVEKMCEFYSRLGRTRHTAIRHSNIYGPHDKFDLERSHVFGATMTKVMTTDTGRITVWGEGREARDLLHVDDLVRFVEAAMARQTAPFELVNVGCGHAIEIRKLVETIIRLSGRAVEVEHDLSKPTIPTRLSLDCARAREVFGWTPSVSLEEGVRRTIEWYRAEILGAK